MGDGKNLSNTLAWLGRVRRFWFSFEPMRHPWWELLVLRSGIAWITWITIDRVSPSSAQPKPHGMATWGWDFTWIGNKAIVEESFFTLDLPGLPVLGISLLTVWALSLILYAVGVFPVLTLIPPLVASVSLGVLGNSQGAIGHTTQIVSMVLLAAWMAAVWSHVCALRGRQLPHGLNAGQLGVDWARQSIIATYVVSALTKLVSSGGNWLADTPYFGLQIVKSQGMAFYTHLVPADDLTWLAQYFIDHPIVAQTFIGAGLPLELFAFLALLNRRIALVYGLLLMALHYMLTEVMSLGFLYHKYLLLVLFVNPVWWVWSAGDGLRKKLVPVKD